MKLMKCSNNHYYDGDVYSTCPHCKEVSDDPKTEKLDRNKVKSATSKDKAGEDSLWDSGDYGLVTGGSEKQWMKDSSIKEDQGSEIDDFNITEKLSSRQRNKYHDALAEDTSAVYEEVALPKRSAPSVPDDDGKTVRFSSRKEDAKEPLVGWLVGLNGAVYGEGFPLVTGRNYIGRGLDMDVVLRGDPSVSRNKHAVVIYEPKSRQFLLQPGESKELFYLDNNVVLDTQVMKTGCELCIGDTRLKFVAFCGEDFSWETNA